MEDYANYTTEELNDLFEIVNSEHLHLKGRDKVVAKRQFTRVWKRDNKGLGCFELFTKLYESHDRFEEEMEWWNEHANFPAKYYREKKVVPYAKYAKHIGFVNEQIHELEQKLEEVESGKGYISQEDYESKLNEAIQNEKQIIREKSDTIGKLRNEVSFLREKLEHSSNRFDAMKRYYEDHISTLSSND